jgi:hypothetical protein
MKRFIKVLIPALVIITLLLTSCGTPTDRMEDWYGERGDFTSLYVNGVQLSPSSAAWGSITGTLSHQTDLQAALNGLQPLNTNLTGISRVTPSAGYLEYTGSGWTIGAGGGTAAWGSITGTLSNQLDLNSALNGKQASSAVLTGLAGLSWSSGSPIVRMNGASSFTLDTNTYLTSAGTSAGTYNNVTVATSGLVTGGSNVSYLTANQTISFSPSGDISSSGGSGTTSLTPAITVTGIQGVAVPALLSGWLKYNGSSLGWSTPTLGDVTASGAATATASTFSGGLTAGGLTINDNTNVALGTTHGTDIGTATNQKLGFYNVIPIVQPTGDALTALSNLGLIGIPTLSKSDVGLGNVENTALSTWSGSSNITTLGTVTTGTLSGVTLQGTISSGTGLTLGSFSAGTISGATFSSPVFSGAVGSNISLASGYNLNLVNALTTTNTWSGVTSTYTNNAGSTINRWQLVYLDSSGEMELAEGNASVTMPCVAIATASISNGSSGTFMTYGYARDDSDWSWTPNGLIFVSDGTAGALTQTVPTGTGHQVQVVGVAITAHIIYFYPQITIIGLK